MAGLRLAGRRCAPSVVAAQACVYVLRRHAHLVDGRVEAVPVVRLDERAARPGDQAPLEALVPLGNVAHGVKLRDGDGGAVHGLVWLEAALALGADTGGQQAVGRSEIWKARRCKSARVLPSRQAH